MICFAVFLGAAFFPSVAHAYLDPGSVSMVLQATIGAVLAFTVTIGVYWQKFLNLFRKKSKAAKSIEMIKKHKEPKS